MLIGQPSQASPPSEPTGASLAKDSRGTGSHSPSAMLVNQPGSLSLWTLLTSSLFIGSTVMSAGDFGYDPNDELSPEHWADEYADCAGKYQSPIDIEESLVTRVIFPPLKFSGFEELPYTSSLTNNGHTVVLEINSTEPITIAGGPLKSSYTFRQLHFHWGVNDSFGSEDLINNHSYSMELHMVFFKTQYITFENALEHKDGLTVLAVFFEVSKRDNKVYSELTDGLKRVIWPNSQTELPYQLPLEFLLPRNRHHYFTYNGSLTTPPCLEIVTWIEFKHPVRLSHKQLENFRKLRSPDGFLTHNGRPVQPLHGRPVLYNIGEVRHWKEKSASSTSEPVPMVLLSMLIIYKYLASQS